MEVLPEVCHSIYGGYDHQHCRQDIGYKGYLPGIKGFLERLLCLIHGVVQAQPPE